MADEKGSEGIFVRASGRGFVQDVAEVSLWLDATRMAEDIKPQRIYEIIDLLDTAPKSHQRKLAMEYVGGGNRLQRFKEQRHLEHDRRVQRPTWRGLRVLPGPDGSGCSGYGALKPAAPDPDVPRLRALTLELKWALIALRPGRPDVVGPVRGPVLEGRARWICPRVVHRLSRPVERFQRAARVSESAHAQHVRDR